jgi:hypothetical protein
MTSITTHVTLSTVSDYDPHNPIVRSIFIENFNKLNSLNQMSTGAIPTNVTSMAQNTDPVEPTQVETVETDETTLSQPVEADEATFLKPDFIPLDIWNKYNNFMKGYMKIVELSPNLKLLSSNSLKYMKLALPNNYVFENTVQLDDPYHPVNH